MDYPEKRYGYCKCGCGQKTRIAKYADYKYGIGRGEPRNFLAGHSLKLEKHGENHPRWKKDRRNRNKKYFLVRMPNHPRSHKGNASHKGFVLEHIVVAEKVLGKYLPARAIVHHVDGDGFNNKNSNLVICEDQSYHKLIHRRENAYRACDHASWRRCSFCKKYDDENNMHPENRRGNRQGVVLYHRECLNDYSKRNKVF